jgi:nitrate reductase NapAB chaperone NapD
MKPDGRFVIKGATITVVEASIYESRIGTAETSIYDLVFDNGVSLKVKTTFIANLEQIEVIEEDEEGRIVLAIDGHGTFQTFGENQEVLFESPWQVNEEPRVVVYNNLITELKIPVIYSGEGINSYEGNKMSGQMILNMIGLDESGTGVYEIQGEGKIQPANE